jgi:AAA+ superfamily predicted ATPase
MKSLVSTLSPTDSSVPLRIAEALATSFSDLIRKPFSGLNLKTFEHRGLCKVTWRAAPSVAQQFYWTGLEHNSLARSVSCGIADVEWQSETFVLAEFQWLTPHGSDSQTWLMARNEDAIDRFALTIYRVTNTPHMSVLVFSGGCWNENRSVYNTVQSSSFETLVLEASLVEELRKDFKAFLNMRDEYEGLGVPWRRGALFVGPPGNGKTQCLRALANELDIPTLYVQSLKSRYETEEAMIARVFNRARQLQPCLLIFEDLDALITKDNRSVFLNQMDGFERNVGLIVVGTTNHPERLDPSILERPSRFDRKYHFKLPSRTLRERYVVNWKDKLAGRIEITDTLTAEIVAQTEGFSFAYLQELFVSALMRSASEHGQNIDQNMRACLHILRDQMQTGRDMLYPSLPDEPDDDDVPDML